MTTRREFLLLPLASALTGCLSGGGGSNSMVNDDNVSNNINNDEGIINEDDVPAEIPETIMNNRIIVGPGADFEDMATALGSITDNSETNPYQIIALPGIYDANWSAKEWVTVQGSGALATIFEGAGTDGIKIGQSNIHLMNFGIRFITNNRSQAAINRESLTTSVYLSGIHIESFGPGAAISNSGGDIKQTWWLRDLKIRTEGIGLNIRGHVYCDDLKIFMFGTASGHSHAGCRVTGSGSRIFLNNCRIGTGYGFENKGVLIPNEVSGEDDVIGIWIPAGYDKARVEIHGLESFCRNEDTINPAVNVNVIRAETGWVRAFGCFGQAETPADWSVRKTLVQAGTGKIEQYACRFTGIQGNSFGSNTMGVQTFTHADDGYTFDKFEGGLHRLDATVSPFTLFLRRPQSENIPGELHIFKKVDDVNPVTIDLNKGLLEGDATNPVLGTKYEELRIVWDGFEWVRA